MWLGLVPRPGTHPCWGSRGRASACYAVGLFPCGCRRPSPHGHRTVSCPCSCAVLHGGISHKFHIGGAAAIVECPDRTMPHDLAHARDKPILKSLFLVGKPLLVLVVV